MDPEPNKIDPFKDYDLFCNPQDPNHTLVMLKKIEHMGYFRQSYTNEDGSYKKFPNFYILNNVKVAHQQKARLHAILKQKTDSQIMIREFCRLAYYCYEQNLHYAQEVRNLETDFAHHGSEITDQLSKIVLLWYTKQTFFYVLVNRLLRAGKNSTQVYYAQYFIKMLSKAIRLVYRKQKKQKQKQVSGTFKCYRGTYLSQQEFNELEENEGRHIQTLGFLSTSLQKQAALPFITNCLIEIDVNPDSFKDQQLDFGYAYLTEQYSEKQEEKEVLFNVLASFQIISAEKLPDYWKIQLKYGVTHGIMRKFNQDKLSHQRDSPDQELIKSILSHQKIFEKIRKQEHCWYQQDAIDEHLYLRETKISLCKSIPSFQQIARLQQRMLDIELTTDKKLKTKVKQQNRIKKPLNTQDATEQQIAIQIMELFTNKNYQQVLSLVPQWRKVKQQLCKSQIANLLYQPVDYSSIQEQMQQRQNYISVLEVISNLDVYGSMGDMPKIIEWMQNAERLLPQLLKAKGRYNQFYGNLNMCYMEWGGKLGLFTYQEYLEKADQAAIRINGRCDAQSSPLPAELVQIWKQAYKYLKQGAWADAVKVCYDFMSRKDEGSEEQDLVCFNPIIFYCSNQPNTLLQKLQILQASLQFKYSKKSRFYQQTKRAWDLYKNQQKQHQIQYIKEIGKTFEWQSGQILVNLLRVKQNILPEICTKDSMLWVTNQCLVINAYRILGLYEEANALFYQLKRDISHNPKYLDLLHQFEQQQALQRMD